MSGIVVSVVVAVYNGEKTLRRCVDSILAQSLTALEIIIIDDGSTDGTASIGREYACLHDNILFFQNETNMGLGSTENFGVSKARGEYIGFVDADDYISPNFYLDLYNAACLYPRNSDIVSGSLVASYPDYDVFSSIKDNNLHISITHPFAEPTFGSVTRYSPLVYAGFWGAASSCAKIVKKSLYSTFPFFEGRCCDDLPSILPIISQMQSILHVKKAYYFYVQSENSMERNNNLVNRLDAFDSIGETLRRYKQVEADKEYSLLLIATSFLNVAGSLIHHPQNQNHPSLYAVICEKLSKRIAPIEWVPLIDERLNPYLKEALLKLHPDKQDPYRQMLAVILKYGNNYIEGRACMQNVVKQSGPLVSIIIPVYNGSNYLGEAIESALSQTYGNKEIIVVNDGSVDAGATDLIACSYGSKITYYTKKNGGVASALNYGIERANGEFISWLSHDDLYASHKVAREVEVLEANSGLDIIVYSAYKTIDANGDTIAEYHIPSHVAENTRCLLALDITYTLNGCSTLIPKKLLLETPFNEELRYTQDYDLWFRLSERVSYIYIDECLIYSRQHAHQDSRTAGRPVTIEADRFHCKAIRSLSWREMIPYLQNGQSLEALWNAYRDAGFPGTSAAILALNATYARQRRGERRLIQFLCNEVGLVKESEEAIMRLLDENIMEKPRLVINTNIWIRGGIERVLSVLIPYFCEHFSVVMISCPYQEMDGFDLPADVPHIKIVSEHSTSLGIRIAALAQMMHADIFIGNQNAIEGFLSIYYVLNMLDIRSIALNHYFYLLPYQIPSFYPIAQARHDAFRYTDVVLWTTHFSATMCAAKCDHVGVIANPSTYPIVQGKIERKGKKILAVGRFFDSMKRVDRIVDVFEQVIKKEPDAELVLVGGYEMDIVLPSGKSLRQLLSDGKFSAGSVNLIGEQSDVRTYYEGASILLLASDCEGFGMVLTEAAVYGVPAVVYGTPGLGDIITNGKNGYLVPEGQLAVAVDHIIHLLQDDDHWKDMSREAQRMAERFSPKKIASKWNALLNMLLKNSDKSMALRLSELQLGLSSSADMATVLDMAQEYEKLIHASGTTSENSPSCILTPSGNNDYWQNAYHSVLQSTSWKITRPLRLVKSAVLVFKAQGMKGVFTKVGQRIRK